MWFCQISSPRPRRWDVPAVQKIALNMQVQRCTRKKTFWSSPDHKSAIEIWIDLYIIAAGEDYKQNQMTLEKLIREFEDGQSNLYQIIDGGTFDQVKATDKSVAESFERILKHEPANSTEHNKLMGFLLQQMPGFCPSGKINKQISEKIASLLTQS